MTEKYLLVLASPLKASIPALFREYYKDLEFDVQYLCSEPKEKILKKDVDLNFEVMDDYKVVCPVGAEALKYTTGLTGITKYNGIVTNQKFVPLLDPNMVFVKPQYEEDLKKAFKKLQDIKKGVVTVNIEKNYKHITEASEFETYFKSLKDAEEIVVDIETTSLSPRKGRTLGVVFSTKPHEGVYVDSPIIYQYQEELHSLFLEKTIIFHNAKFDMSFLNYEFGFEFPKFEDTMLLHYVLDESVGTHGLKQLALKYTDLGDYERELDEYKKTYCRKNKIKLEDFNYGMIPTEILADYAERDGDATYQLYAKFKPLVDKNDKFSSLYNNLLKPTIVSLTHMENNGGPISVETLDYLIQDYQIDIEETHNELAFHPAIQQFEQREEKVFNPNSIYHLRTLFFDILKLNPIKKTDMGANSTDAETLKALNHPIAEAILDLRSKVKLSRTYLKNIKQGVDEDCRLRSSFNLTGTTSGRLSSSGVLNYQNLPRDKDSGIKKAFRARDGYSVVQCD